MSEPDPNAQLDDPLEALGLYKDISTEYGLNRPSPMALWGSP